MAKLIFIIASLLSTSIFATELDQPVTNVSDRSRLEKNLPPVIIVRTNEETGASSFLISEEKIAANDEQTMKQIATTSKFTAISSQGDELAELNREGGVASFYFQFNSGFYYPYARYYYNSYARTYNYSYGSYYRWYWGGYTYNCYRLGWY